MEYILDNSNSTYTETGTWGSSTWGGYKNNSRFHTPGTGASASWQINIPINSWSVQATWVKNANRSKSVTYQLLDQSGAVITQTTVNQQLDPVGSIYGGRPFQSLFKFTNNQNVTVKILSATDGYVIADAVRFVTTSVLPDLGINTSLTGCQVFPVDNPWNTDISQLPVDPNSNNLIASIGNSTHIHPDFGSQSGMLYIVVPGSQPNVPINIIAYPDESDPGPYPIPDNMPIEDNADPAADPNTDGDRHSILIDRDNWLLYEMFRTFHLPGKSWQADGGSKFDLKSNNLRPLCWTSTDAAGLPILPGLIRYEEILAGVITHAIRFTCQVTRHAFIFPARHYASSNTNPNSPPMGMRIRLKSNFDISSYNPTVKIILTAMKKYGLMLADNGSNWFFQGTMDSRWNDDDLHQLTGITGNNFEVTKMGPMTTSC